VGYTGSKNPAKKEETKGRRQGGKIRSRGDDSDERGFTTPEPGKTNRLEKNKDTINTKGTTCPTEFTAVRSGRREKG